MRRTVVIGMVLAVLFGTVLVVTQQRFSARGTELWTRQFGSTADDKALGVVVDARGNVLVVGWTEGILPGQKRSAEGVDAFVGKYDPTGKELWTRQFGTLRGHGPIDHGVPVFAVDAQGNVLVVGTTQGTLPGQRSAGRRDAFVRKYDPNGKHLWTHQFGSAADDEVLGVAVDARGNVLVVGWTYGTLTGQKSAGESDAFVRKYDPNGKHLWTRQFGSTRGDGAYGVAVDARGNVLVVGWTYGTFPGQKRYLKRHLTDEAETFVRKYDPNGKELWTRQLKMPIGSFLYEEVTVFAVDVQGNVLVAGGTDVRKYAPSGKELWTRQLGSTDKDKASGVAIDARGNVLVVGWTYSILPGTWVVEVFVRKYDPTGKELWSRQFRTLSGPKEPGMGIPPGVAAVAVDSRGNVLVVGSTDGTLLGQKSAGEVDAFVRKYDPNGKELWTRQFGSTTGDGASGVAVDAHGNVLVVGDTYGALPGQKSMGERDVFVRKYSP